MNNHGGWLRNMIGIAAIIALVGMLVLAYFLENKKNKYFSPQEGCEGTIFFDSDLVYDGAGSLDLMRGVTADDGTGNVVNDQVSAVITSEGTLAKKIVRYTFIDASGNTVTEKRNLQLNRYKGPELDVAKSISLTADDLPDVIRVLKEQELLKAENGYGKDITDTVTCLRQHKNRNTYEMTFSVVNEFSDSLSVTRTAEITGKVTNPVLTLRQAEVKVNAGTYFEPSEWIKSAYDGEHSVSYDNVEIHSPVDITTPGPYTVTYRLYNADRTAMTEVKLKVTVR